jgi:hypothetical protein
MRRVLLALALLAPAALAPGTPGAPLEAEIHTAGLAGNGWHTVALEVQGAGLLTARADASPPGARTVAAGLWLLDASGAVVAKGVGAAWTREVQVHLATPAGVLVDLAIGPGPGSPPARFDVVVGPGRYTLVAAVGGDGPLTSAITGEVRLTGDAPTLVGASRDGDGVLVLREHGLDTALAAEAAAYAPALGGAGVRVVTHASVGRTVEHRLFGAFSGHANGHLDMALVTPEGVQSGSTHYALDALDGGAYQFLLRDFVDASPFCAATGCDEGGVWLLAADVDLR